LGSAAALGVKNTVQAPGDFIIERFTQRSLAKETRRQLGKAVSQVERLSREIADVSPRLARLGERVQADYELWNLGLLDRTAVQHSVDQFVTRYRERRDTEAPVASAENLLRHVKLEFEARFNSTFGALKEGKEKCVKRATFPRIYFRTPLRGAADVSSFAFLSAGAITRSPR